MFFGQFFVDDFEPVERHFLQGKHHLHHFAVFIEDAEGGFAFPWVHVVVTVPGQLDGCEDFVSVSDIFLGLGQVQVFDEIGDGGLVSFQD